jgi:hypothetical protein
MPILMMVVVVAVVISRLVAGLLYLVGSEKAVRTGPILFCLLLLLDSMRQPAPGTMRKQVGPTVRETSLG